MNDSIVIPDVVADLKRVQEFDCMRLVRRDKLGDLNFEDAVEPAKRLISIFAKLPETAIPEFPAKQMAAVQKDCKAVYALFEQIMNFNLSMSDAVGLRTQYIEAIKEAYQPTFDRLFPLISYSVARTVDFSSIESGALAALQSIRDEKQKLISELTSTSEQAKVVLEQTRAAAAEQGVTQMARYFADEAVGYKKSSNNWLIASICMSVLVAGYSISTFFLNFLFDATTYVAIAQLAVSKVLVFGVLIFGLIQCVKVYLAHNHNFVTNKHRQNALLTFKTLAEAGNTTEARDVVLQFAASAIYTPSESGFLKGEDRSNALPNLINLAPRGALTSPSTLDAL